MDKIKHFSFVYNMTEHCNLTCHACDHAAPLFPEMFTDPEMFKSDLLTLHEVYHAQQMRITGGEPLLHPRLLEFFRIAREIGIADWLILVTNGVLLHKAPDELWELIDEIWLSIYPRVRLAKTVEEYAVLARNHEVVFTPVVQNTFMVTILNNRIESAELVGEIFKACKMTGEWSCHTVHGGRYYKCSPAPFMSRRLAKIGLTAGDFSLDSIALHNNPDLYGQLKDYLAEKKPLLSCQYCLGTSGPEERHHLVNPQGIELWCQEDHHPIIEEMQQKLLGKPPLRQ